MIMTKMDDVYAIVPVITNYAVVDDFDAGAVSSGLGSIPSYRRHTYDRPAYDFIRLYTAMRPTTLGKRNRSLAPLLSVVDY